MLLADHTTIKWIFYMSKQQLSKHRHISFTAHYTGYIWYQMGISHPAFATSKGKFLTQLVHPFETWAERVVGGSMRITLQQRHKMIDDTLIHLIEKIRISKSLKLLRDYHRVVGIFVSNIRVYVILKSIYPIWLKRKNQH